MTASALPQNPTLPRLNLQALRSSVPKRIPNLSNLDSSKTSNAQAISNGIKTLDSYLNNYSQNTTQSAALIEKANTTLKNKAINVPQLLILNRKDVAQARRKANTASGILTNTTAQLGNIASKIMDIEGEGIQQRLNQELQTLENKIATLSTGKLSSQSLSKQASGLDRKIKSMITRKAAQAVVKFLVANWPIVLVIVVVIILAAVLLQNVPDFIKNPDAGKAEEHLQTSVNQRTL